MHSTHRAQKQQQRKNQLGFTLIEILMSVSLVGLIGVAAAGLFYTTLIGNSKKEVLTTVKQEGDYAIGQMEFLLRNAVALAPDPNVANSVATCAVGMTKISIRSKDNGITTFSIQNGKIASQSGTATPVYLTSDAVTIADSPSDLVFNCSQASTNRGTYINVGFTLTKTSPDYNEPSTVTQAFSTGVGIRSY
jgi:prepilin-type N-terminal cleavage/methylation domain-containing protein